MDTHVHAGAVRRTLGAVVVLVAVVVGAVTVARPADDLRPALESALGSVPADVLSASFTDWQAVRATLGSPHEPSPQQRAALLDAAFDEDLSSASVLSASQQVMDETYGWSVWDTRWELLGQGRDGATVVVRLDDDVQIEAVADTLTELGYPRPATGARSGGVWAGGVDLVSELDAGLTPLLAHVALLEDQQLVVLSDTADYAGAVVDSIASGETFGADPDVAATSLPLYGGVLAVLHRTPQNCAVTSYADASTLDARDAAAAADGAGGLTAHRSLGFGLTVDGDERRLEVAMRFPDAAVATTQQDVRDRLTSGSAVGQGGTYDERFEVVSSSVQDTVLHLGLRPVAERTKLVSDLTNGPLLFAWCGG